MKKTLQSLPKGMLLFFVLSALVAVGNGFSDSIYANYFSDAYNVDAVQRGFLEFPREFPGVCCALVLAALGFMGDIKLSIIAQLLACAGLAVLGFTTPSFGMMCVFLFINSLGMHLFFPLQDAIGMRLAEPGRIGVRMGQYASVRSIIGLVCALVVFIGFRMGTFSFTYPIKHVFVFGAVGFLLSAGAAVLLMRSIGTGAPAQGAKPQAKFIYRPQYRYYYALSVLQGVQKQITYVYGSWVVIRILNLGPDVMSLLVLASSLMAMVFVPLLGGWLDRYGIRRILQVNAYGFIGIYSSFALVVLVLHRGTLAVNALSIGLVCALFTLDRISLQFAMVRSIYLRDIALDGNDVSPTLSAGTSLDHIVTIIAAPLCGLVWTRFGPHWVFLIAALFSLGNVYIANRPDLVHPK